MKKEKVNSFSNDKRKNQTELSLFEDETISYTKKFYFLMDLIVSNQQGSKIEIFIFFWNILCSNNIFIFFS